MYNKRTYNIKNHKKSLCVFSETKVAVAIDFSNKNVDANQIDNISISPIINATASGKVILKFHKHNHSYS